MRLAKLAGTRLLLPVSKSSLTPLWRLTRDAPGSAITVSSVATALTLDSEFPPNAASVRPHLGDDRYLP